MVVPEVPQLYRKLRKACKKKIRYILSKPELVVPNHDQKTFRGLYRTLEIKGEGI